MLLHVSVLTKPSSGNLQSVVRQITILVSANFTSLLKSFGLVAAYVGAFVIYFNLNFNVLKQIYCALED